MNGIPASVIPPPNGLDKEEPEFAEEDDIPTDDNSDAAAPPGRECGGVERE
jgi:hypothetical protein